MIDQQTAIQTERQRDKLIISIWPVRDQPTI